MPRLPAPGAQRYDTPEARKMDQFEDVRVQMPENPRIFEDSACPKKAQIGRFGIGPLGEYGGVLPQPILYGRYQPQKAESDVPPWLSGSRCHTFMWQLSFHATVAYAHEYAIPGWPNLATQVIAIEWSRLLIIGSLCASLVLFPRRGRSADQSGNI